MKTFLIFLAFSFAFVAFAQLKVCYGPVCGTVDNNRNVDMNLDFLGSVGSAAMEAWEKFKRIISSDSSLPNRNPTVSPPSSVSQPNTAQATEPFDPYDVIVKFVSIEDFIAKGSYLQIASYLLESLKASTSLREFDLDTFVGSIMVVNGMFKQGKSWFCQRLSGLPSSFLAGYNFATEGFSSKRVNILGMKGTLVDVQGYGFPVDVLTTFNLINQQILEEIIRKVSYQIGDAFIQVINAFSQEDQKLMMINAARAQAMDRLAAMDGERRMETLSIVVHNVRDKSIAELVGHVRHNVMGKLPNHQCIQMTSVPNLEAEVAKLQAVPGFNESVCEDFKMGEFYMTSSINGKMTYHFFLAAEGPTSGGYMNEAVLMNDIALLQLRNNLRIGLVQRGNQRRGVLIPIIEGIMNAIPEYLIKINASSAASSNANANVVKETSTVSVDHTGSATSSSSASHSPSSLSTSPSATSTATAEEGKILIALDQPMMIRPELYEIIPMAKLPLPTPPAPYRIYHVMGKKKSNGKSELRNIIVEVDFAGFNVDRTEFDRNVGKLSVTLHRDPFYLNREDVQEIFSELVFGSTTKEIHLGTFALPNDEQLVQSICPSDNGFVRIIFENNCCKFDDSTHGPLTCANVKQFISNTRPTVVGDGGFYRWARQLFGW